MKSLHRVTVHAQTLLHNAFWVNPLCLDFNSVCHIHFMLLLPVRNIILLIKAVTINTSTKVATIYR